MRRRRLACCWALSFLVLLAEPSHAEKGQAPPRKDDAAGALPGPKERETGRKPDADAYETVVTTKRCPRRVLPYAVEIVSREEIARSRAQTLAEVVEGKPGISFESDGPANSRIGIRGLARERVGLLLDGNPQLLTRNAGTDIPIDPWDVDRIEIVKGANALACAPGAMGGLTNVILRRPVIPAHGWSTGLEAASGFSSVNHSTRGALRAHMAGQGGLYAQVSGTIHYPASNIRAGEGLELLNTDHRLFTGSLIAGRKVRDSLVELTYYGRFGLPVGTYRSKLYQDPDLRQIVAAKLRRERLGVFKTLELKASYMRFDVDFRFLADDLHSTKKWFIGEWHNVAVEAWSGLDLLRGHDISTGVNFYWATTQRWQESAAQVFVGEIFPHAGRLATGLFVQDRLSIGDWLLISGVLRLDYDQLSHDRRESAASSSFEQAARLDRVRARSRDYVSLSGNLGANIFLAEPLTLRFNVGTAVRPPVPGKFSVFIPASATAPGRIGNPEIAAERSLNVELGGRYAGASTTIDTTAFFTSIFDYMTEYPSRSLRDPAGAGYRYRTFANQDAMLYGAELGIRQVLFGRYLAVQGSISYAVGFFFAPLADSTTEDTDLPLVPPLRGFVALTSRPLPNLHLMLKARYAAAQHRNSEAAGEQPTPGYALLDLNVDYTFRRLWCFEDLTLYLKLLNMTDMRYKEHTVQYTGVAVGFEEAYLQPGIDLRFGLSLKL